MKSIDFVDHLNFVLNSRLFFYPRATSVGAGSSIFPVNARVCDSLLCRKQSFIYTCLFRI